MLGRSLVMVAVAIIVLVSSLGRLDAQSTVQTTTATLSSGQTVEIVINSIRLPILQPVVTVVLPSGTTATRADGGDVTFPTGATVYLPLAALAATQPSSPAPPAVPARQGTVYWAVFTTAMQFTESRPFIVMFGPFPNGEFCDEFIKERPSKPDTTLQIKSSACRTDVAIGIAP
jgi:hypothetical protein